MPSRNWTPRNTSFIRSGASSFRNRCSANNSIFQMTAVALSTLFVPLGGEEPLALGHEFSRGAFHGGAAARDRQKQPNRQEIDGATHVFSVQALASNLRTDPNRDREFTLQGLGRGKPSFQHELEPIDKQPPQVPEAVDRPRLSQCLTRG